MKKHETLVTGAIIVVGLLLLFYLYRNSGSSSASTTTAGTPLTSGPVTENYNISPQPGTYIGFTPPSSNINVVSYLPLFGFIGVGNFWS